MIGYARVSTDEQDLTAQRDALTALGVAPDRIYVDHGLTGTNRARPGLREAMAACRAGDTLVVTKLDRLARSLPDARDIVAELTAREVKLSLGGSVPRPDRPGRAAVVQRSGHGRRVRVRPDHKTEVQRRSRTPTTTSAATTSSRPGRDGTGQRRPGPDVGVAPPPDLPRHDDLQALFAFDGLIWEGEPLS
jgi:resolvase-like protein